MKQILKGGAYALLASAVFACTSGSKDNEKKMDTSQQHEHVHGLDVKNMDLQTYPGQDFYGYANGGWLARTKIPSDQTRWGSFGELAEENNNILRRILTEASESKKYKTDSDQGKAVTIYQLGMDSARISADGIKPLQAYFGQINALQNKQDLGKLLADLHNKGIGGFFGDYVYIDKKDSEKKTVYVVAGGTSLPDRDYYLKPSFEKVRGKYSLHLAKMFELLGDSKQTAEKEAALVLKMETALAKAQLSRVELRDPKRTYNKMSVADLDKKILGFNMKSYFASSGYTKVPYIIVQQPDFMTAMNGLIQSSSIEDIKTYLRWKLIDAVASYLPSEFETANWEFYAQTLKGAKEMKPRWKRVLGTVNGTVGFAVGKVYVEEVFPPEAKAKALEMVKDIQDVFSERINQLDWMSEETKVKAQNKLKAFRVKIGYPDKWETYEKLDISPKQSYVAAVISASEFERKKNIDDLHKPIDKTKWHMTPQTVNAYYSPVSNEIVFPAAILQPPFYDYKADAAVNYGGIGAVIGHEITHGFDDQGRQYDAKGNLNDWWTTADAERFTKKADKVVKQFDGYVVLDSLHVNGKLTLGENIADLGGITMAYYALQKYLARHGRPENIDNLTPEQRLFVSWATVWRAKYTDKALRNRLITDVHAPAMIRGFAPLSNLKEFEKAFSLKETDKMVRPDSIKIKIW
ncbi:endothelin-converting protein [Fulvitalea axinellae]|uniref:Endothelin-converting protein n=1 Tax=Fulvitalea axinellae TaxID=1182444 RepID=A0AAU9CDQ2_9BACT|nr:endothelin-converting protein [Fulvitalea axinellae]